ncbi:hypothetical protein GCM10011529_10130 [Polymorphobacter glacialis]|uniref:HTH lysR-type domain-containing protein n=1 Tax=Sandarakinorhabdus glacialis TaxID=1614636 RepID=A0A917E5R7_9SPHN|nr:hypothetical protein GCM10011529_10130 [Polymorphobacter glacialis]
MIESRRLRQFLAVYELGSIGQAAERLLLTQPALSKSLRGLEDELGVRLFDRTPQGVLPTGYGELLAGHARIIEAQLRQAEAAIGAMRGKAQGHVVAGIAPSVAAKLMPLATIALRQRHPGIELSVIEGLAEDLLPQLRDGQVDVAIGAWATETRVPGAGFTAEMIVVDALEAFVRESHPLVDAARPIALETLLDCQWALPPESQAWRQIFDGLFTERGLVPPRPSVVSTSAGYLKSLMLQGDYLSFLPSQLITPETDGLVPLPIDAPRMHPDISMIFQDGRWRRRRWPRWSRCCARLGGSLRRRAGGKVRGRAAGADVFVMPNLFQHPSCAWKIGPGGGVDAETRSA